MWNRFGEPVPATKDAMRLRVSDRTARSLRVAGLVAAAFALAAGATSMSLAIRLRPDFIRTHTGVFADRPQLDIVDLNQNANHVGDPVMFTLRSAEGATRPSSLPTDFPMYPGARIVRSAAFSDQLRRDAGEVLVVPTDPAAAVAWYRSRLSADGWTTAVGAASLTPAGYLADRGDLRARIDAVPSAGGRVATTVTIYVFGQ